MKNLFLLCCLLISVFSYSQTKEDVKVGLVLSGGGAKGLAHIGALKVLEEAGVRIDYIGGTSMGAIVGSLYASGYTAAELDSIFHETNFTNVIQDDLPREAKTFHEKEDSDKYALTLPFDDFDLSFPSGLSKGQNLYNLLSRLTAHVNHINDFSNLPIPFFCVATNVETGAEVILETGSLPKAVSASGALPSVFSPVFINDTLLTDGGVINNFPADEMRKRGVDIIIGVDVQDNLVDRDELNSVFEILGQISNFRTAREMSAKRDFTDIYIKPDITDFSVLSFERGESIIDSGEVAARRKFESLQEIASRQTYRRKKPDVLPQVESLRIMEIDVRGINNYPRSYIIGKLQIKTPAEITYRELNLGINNLSATGNFRRITHSIIAVEGGYKLILDVEESKNTTLLRLAVHYDELFKSGALINLTQKRLFFTNDVTTLDFVVGDNIRYNFEYYIDKGYYWSIGLKSRLSHFDRNVDVGFVQDAPPENLLINKVAIDYLDVTNQFYVETLLKKYFSFGLGAEHKYLKIESETLPNVSTGEVASNLFENNHYYSGFGYVKLDNLDNRYFPTKGFLLDADFHLYLFSSSFNNILTGFSVAKASGTYVTSPLPKISTRFTAAGGFRLGENDNNYFNFFLGGYGNAPLNNLQPFLGYDYAGIAGNSYLKAQVDIDYRFYKKHHLIATANFANVEDNLFATGNWLSLPDYSGYAIGYGLDSFVGPLEVKYSYSPETHDSHWFFSIGYWF